MKNKSVLRGYRNKEGLSQSQLADAIGVTYKQIFRWESKAQVPSAKNCAKLCIALNINKEDVYELIYDYMDWDEFITGNTTSTDNNMITAENDVTTGELMNCLKTPRENCAGCYVVEHCTVSRSQLVEDYTKGDK